MKLNPIQIAVLAGACSLASSAAHADATAWDPSWSFSGFGTLAYVQTNTNLGLYAGPGQPSGAGKDGTLGVDSKLAGQVNAKANNVFSGTVQVLSQRNGDGNFKPAIEWAFAKAQVTPELAVRVGRIGAPLFAVSDYRNVGYVNLWARTPPDVYGQVGFSHFDGADVIYQLNLSGTTLTSQAFYGVTNTINSGTPVHVRHEMGLNLTAEFEYGITLRAGRVQGKLTVDNPQLTQLVGGIRQASAAVAPLGIPSFSSVADEIDTTDKDASFTGLGIAIDHENWVGGVEYTKRKTSSYVSSTTGWAVTGGYRFGKFTPYAVVSKLKVDSTNVNNTIPALNPTLAFLKGSVDGLVGSSNIAQKTNTIGLRWDAIKNVDFKAEYARVTVADGARGLFNAVKPGFGDSAVSVYTVALDFVF